VFKLSLGTGSSLPQVVGSVTLATNELYLYAGVIDAINGYAYWGTNDVPGSVVKVALGSGSSDPFRVGSVTFPTGYYLNSAVIDEENGYSYW